MKSKMWFLFAVGSKEIQKARGLNKKVAILGYVEEYVDVFVNILLDIKWRGLKANYIELGLIMFVKFLCYVLTIKDTN